MKRPYPLSLWGWCAVIFVASFMPWATSAVTLPLFGGTGMSAIATGWTGNSSFLGVLIPNWIAVALAGALAAIGWLQANGTVVQPQVSFRIALVGLLHAIFFVLFFFRQGGAQLGLGAVATLVAFVAILRLLKKAPAHSSVLPS